MRILLYNWVPFDNPQRGGGVTVYTRNLVDGINALHPECEVYFLCSGVYYDEKNAALRIEKIKMEVPCNCKAYAVINSPVFSPAYLSFYHMERTLESPRLKEAFAAFLEKFGNFDVVHFQNLEGLSIDVLECATNFPKTKFVYSVHNYYPFCPQVNFWKNGDVCCESMSTGEECIDCMVCHVPDEKLIKKMSMTYSLKCRYSDEKKVQCDLIGRELDQKYKDEETRPLTTAERNILKGYLEKYRKSFVNAINNNIDTVLAVSQRVKELSVKYGIREDITVVSYIGTKAAETAINHCKNITDNIVNVVFMGYQRQDKGFFFLIDVLNALDENVSKKMNVFLAAKGDARSESLWRIGESKFNSFIYKNGYTRDEIGGLLANANLGIIPVLWEDNLPQVAIEMVSNGIPILCADKGGARELSNNSDFIFKAGDLEDCVKHLSMIVHNPSVLKHYYDDFNGLTTMEKHIADLWNIHYK